jgi:hypothetical protein
MMNAIEPDVETFQGLCARQSLGHEMLQIRCEPVTPGSAWVSEMEKLNAPSMVNHLRNYKIAHSSHTASRALMLARHLRPTAE